ncbi:hypothetical protein GCM10028818_01150 [Spirosoma horti]
MTSNEKKFKKGDVVKLNSGGLQMTISHFVDTLNKNDGAAKCVYFDASGVAHEITVHLEAIMKVE